MSTYYILVNKDKKEWIDSGDLGLGLKEHVYETAMTPLLGFLMLNTYVTGSDKQYNSDIDIVELDENQHDSDFTFCGHWSGDRNIELVSEHREEYEICHGYEGYKNESREWVNITIPLAKEWNYRIRYWYGDTPEMQEWIRYHSFEVKN